MLTRIFIHARPEVEMEFTEAESNMQDLVAEYQQYQDATYVQAPLFVSTLADLNSVALRRRASTRRRSSPRRSKRLMVLLPFLSSLYESTTFSYSWAWLAAPAFPCIRFRSLTYASLFNECLFMMDDWMNYIAKNHTQFLYWKVPCSPECSLSRR